MSEASRSVLLVDGDARRAQALKRALDPGGIVLVPCSQRSAAIDALRNNPFDAVVVGWDVVDARASELMRELQLSFPDVPVIAILPGDDIDQASGAVAAGAVDY